MEVQQPELLNPREKHWSKSQLPSFEARIPVIPRGLVAARVLAFQAVPDKTRSTNSRVISRQKLPNSREFEGPPSIKRRPKHKNPRNSCEPLPLVTQTPSSDDHQSSRTLSLGKPVPGSESGEGRSANNWNLEEKDAEAEKPIGLFRDDMADNVADEAGDILDGATNHQPWGDTNAKEGPKIERAPSFCLNTLDRGMRLPEAKRSCVDVPPTKIPTLGGRVGNGTIPLGSSRPHPSTLLETNQSKKYRFWRGGEEKSIPCDSLETARTISSHVTPQPQLHSNVSAAQSQQALTLGPLDPTILEIQDALELHYLSPQQVTCSSTGASVSPGHRNVARTLSSEEAKPLEPTTPARTVRHSVSTTLLRPPSQPSKTKCTQNRWSWWKLGSRKQRATGGISGNSREDGIDLASEREPLIPLEFFPTQPNGYDVGTMGQVCEEEPVYGNDPTYKFQIFNKEPESTMGGIGSSNEGIISPKNNGTQSRSCAELPLASTPPELDLTPSPDLYASPSFAADTLSQERSSSAASTIRLQPDKSGGAMRWRNRGQSFRRIQLIVNLDMRDLVVKAKIEKGKGNLG